MAKCRPGKWVPWSLVGAGLPFLAAAVLNTGGVNSDIASRAAAALGANEATAWASLENNGRDYVVKGTSPSQDAIDAAVKAVAATYGVRTISANAQIVEPVKLEPPTVDSVNVTTATPEVTGTWQEGVAKTLAVGLAGTTYKLGESPELTSQAGKWSLKLANPLPEGNYDVTVEVSDGDKQMMAAAAPGKLVVDLPDPVVEMPALPPLAPAVIPAGAKWPYAITGTWPEAPGAKLSATVAGRSYELGRGAALTSDGKGNFTFAPAAKLAPGSYDVSFAVTDPAGAASSAVLPAAIVIPEPPVVAETPVVAAAQVPLAAPTVTRQLALTGAPIIKGTWPQGQATGLTVAVGPRTYTLGTDANLQSRDGNWSLLPAAALKDGIYDVVVTALGADNTTSRDETVAELEVDGEPPAAPAVTAYSGVGSPPSISGTWDEKQATGLTVTIPAVNVSGTLGAEGSALTSDGGGNWTLALNQALPPGAYDVLVTSTDVHGRTQTDTSTADVEVKAAPPPPPPAIGLYAAPAPAGAVWPYAITGRWSEGTAINLKAELAGRTYEFGRGTALSSDGSGKFTFAPRAAGLAPGEYVVTFTSQGPGGEVRTAQTRITVPGAGQDSTAVIPERAFNCEATLARLNQVFPIRFGFDLTKLEGIAALSLAQYAALLKDPRCAALKVELGGHADFKGTERYNQGLSERRAATVLGALQQAGIDASRLSPIGYSENNPLDPALTDVAREKNRRVEITVAK